MSALYVLAAASDAGACPPGKDHIFMRVYLSLALGICLLQPGLAQAPQRELNKIK